MNIVKLIFQVKFGAYKEAKALPDEVYRHGILHDVKASRILTDFTGDSYRQILEAGFDFLAEYEISIVGELHQQEWKQ